MYWCSVGRYISGEGGSCQCGRVRGSLFSGALDELRNVDESYCGRKKIIPPGDV